MRNTKKGEQPKQAVRVSEPRMKRQIEFREFFKKRRDRLAKCIIRCLDEVIDKFINDSLRKPRKIDLVVLGQVFLEAAQKSVTSNQNSGAWINGSATLEGHLERIFHGLPDSEPYSKPAKQSKPGSRLKAKYAK